MSSPAPASSIGEHSPTLIIVEDDPTTSDIVTLVLKKHGFNPIACYNAKDAVRCLKENPGIKAALIDLALPDGDGIDVLREARQLYAELPCYVLTVKETAQSVVAAMRAGATDYLVKPFDPAELISVLKSAVKLYSSSHEPDARVLGFDPSNRINHWQSPKMRQAFDTAIRASKTSSPVFITGETNTGRKALARLIHSGRKGGDKPLVTIDAAVLKPPQLEVELFGRPLSMPPDELGLGRGKLDRGQGTNLHIANIECLTPLQQANLHMWLTSDEPLQRGKNSKCRLIATSTPAISEAIQKGLFRKDLWYALSIYHIEVPSFAERPEDIPQLCENIITNICISKKLRRPALTRKALEMILDHTWPGNYSELENVLEHALTHTTDRLIGPRDLPQLQSRTGADFVSRGTAMIPIGSTSIDEVTRASLIAALEACGGNRRRAAQRLKVSLRTIYNMIQRYEVASVRKPETEPDTEPEPDPQG